MEHKKGQNDAYMRGFRKRERTALPREPWTVLKRTKTGVVREVSVRTGANVYLAAASLVALKYPCAPAPRA